MATIVTHGLAAALLSTVAPSAVSRLRFAIVLAFLAVLPDADVVGHHLGVAYDDMLGHRGFTHSILFAAIAGFLAPMLFFPAVRVFQREGLLLVALCFSATLSHGVLDAFTVAGLGVGFLIPFQETRYFAPWRPIATSPLGVRAFFEGPASAILRNELFWIGVPAATTFGALHVVRRVRNRAGGRQRL